MPAASHKGSLGASRAMRRKRRRSGENGISTPSYTHSSVHRSSHGGDGDTVSDTSAVGGNADEEVGPEGHAHAPVPLDRGGAAGSQGTPVDPVPTPNFWSAM